MPQRVTSGTPGLKSGQRRVLRALESQPGTLLTRSEYQRLTGVGRSQAANDLSELVSAGRLLRIGGGRSTRYVLAHEPAAQRRWTPDRIRGELAAFCADRRTWPTASEFKTAGRGDLYVAASRYGGVAHWADELGLERFDRSRATATSPRAPLRSRLAWGLTGAAAATALAAAAVLAIVAIHNLGSTGTAGAPASVEPPSAFRVVWKPQRTNVDSRRAVKRPSTKPEPRPRSTPTLQTSSASQRVEAVFTHSAPTTRETAAVVTSSSASPAPLPAPAAASSAPSPLKAP